MAGGRLLRMLPYNKASVYNLKKQKEGEEEEVDAGFVI
jgi:hypothetical protein